MSFVLDNSVSVAWLLEDESSSYTDAVLGRLRSDNALVPAIWPVELANSLLVAERRGRLSAADFVKAIDLSLSLPITVEPTPLELALGNVITLARVYRLTAYDAAYLDLAMREGIPLATQVTDLIAAARVAGLPDLDLG